MRHTLPLQELAVGMYIANPGSNWVELGLYPVEGFISSQAELSFILQSGSPYAVVDSSRCSLNVLSEHVLSKALPEEKKIVSNPLAPKVSMKEEIAKARAVYSESLTKAKSLMEGVRSGEQINPAEAEPVVSGIVESLDQNSDALLGLCKLRENDEYTYAHCVSVSILSIMFARKLKLSREMQELIGLGGLLHDLGKSKIPEAIINAPRKLTAQEFAIIRYHPTLGYKELLAIPDIPIEILNITLQHHEKFNGKGYPQGLKGEEISLAGTMVGITDIFDALTSKRSYKDAMPMHSANGILYNMRGDSFPKHLVDDFIQMIGVYPLGTPVLLSNGYLGIVSETNHLDPLCPNVTVLRDIKGRSILQHDIDLSVEKELSIKSIISQKELCCDVTSILGLPTAIKK